MGFGRLYIYILLKGIDRSLKRDDEISKTNVQHFNNIQIIILVIINIIAKEK